MLLDCACTLPSHAQTLVTDIGVSELSRVAAKPDYCHGHSPVTFRYCQRPRNLAQKALATFFAFAEI